MRFVCILLVAACSSGKTTTDDTDVASDDSDDRPVDTDTNDTVWETGANVDTATEYVRDPKLGPTPVDGTWVGTFLYKEYPELGATTPTCAGTLSFTISGDAPMHVFGTAVCTTWDPNFDIRGLPASVDGPYGEMTGLFTAELDPADYTKFRTTIDFSAPNMAPFAKAAVLVTVDGDTLTIDFHDVKTVPIFGKIGNELTATATRTPAP